MNRTKRSSISLIIMFALIIILGVSTAYAWFTASASGSIDFTFSSGNINIQVTSNNAAINSQTFTKTGVMPGDALLSHDVVANKSEESVSFYFRMEISLDVDGALSDYESALSGMFTASKVGLGTDFVQDTSVTDTAVFYYGSSTALTEVSTTDEILLLDADNFIIPTTLTQLDEYAQAGKGITLTVVVVAIQSANMMNTMAAFKSVVSGSTHASEYQIISDDYLYFGEFPQSLKETSVTVTTAPDANGYYLGSDGERYAKLRASAYASTSQYQVNGATLTQDVDYYFKVEPIKWRILAQADNTYTLVCDNVLRALTYQFDNPTGSGYLDDDNTIAYNSYEHSTLREWLTGTFYDTAFASNLQSMIQSTELNNTTYLWTANSTTDKVYTLSLAEMQNADYGFSTTTSIDVSRVFTASDYAIANGVQIGTNGGAYSWTRSRGQSNLAVYCNEAGLLQTETISANVDYMGVLPAMVVTIAPQSSGTVTEGEIFTENGKQYMYFGSYPQTLKADSVTVGTAPDANGYYTGSDGEKYVKQTAQYDTNWFDEDEWTTEWAGNVAKDGRVMTIGTDYYFKVEPIKWRILSSSNGTYTIVCDSILSGLAYQPYYSGNYATDSEGNVLKDSNNNEIYANNYEYSNLRTWLNGTFYDSAFTSSERSKILTTTVDNSANQYPSDIGVDADNQYLCENTSDKVYALSVADMCNESYGFSSVYDEQDTARYWGTTDYARATGAATLNETYLTNIGITEESDAWDTYAPYIGSGIMWLRSLYPSISYCAYDVLFGYVDYYFVYDASFGVVPALQISL